MHIMPTGVLQTTSGLRRTWWFVRSRHAHNLLQSFRRNLCKFQVLIPTRIYVHERLRLFGAWDGEVQRVLQLLLLKMPRRTLPGDGDNEVLILAVCCLGFLIKSWYHRCWGDTLNLGRDNEQKQFRFSFEGLLKPVSFQWGIPWLHRLCDDSILVLSLGVKMCGQ